MQRMKISIPTFLIWVVIFFSLPLLFGQFILAINILTVISIIFVFLGFANVQFAFLGMAMLAIFDPFRIYLNSNIFRWNTVTYVLLVIMLIYIFRGVKIRDWQSRWLFFLLLLLAVQLSYSKNLIMGFYYMMNLTVFYCFLVIFIANQPKNALFTSSSLIAITLLNLLIHYVFRTSSGSLPYVDHSTIATSAVSGLFTLYLGVTTFDDTPYPRMILTILGIMLFGFVFLTGSRYNVLIAALALIYIFIRLSKRSFSMKILIPVVSVWMAIFFAGQFSIQVNDAQYRFVKLLNPNLSLAQRTSERSDLLDIGWKIVLDHPFGIGTGNLNPQIIASYTNNPVLKLYMLTSVHSAMMKTLAENGFLGGGLLLFFTISFFYHPKQLYDNGLAEIGLFCGAILTTSLFFTEFQGKNLLYLAAGCVYLLHYRGVNLQIGESAVTTQNNSAHRPVRTGRVNIFIESRYGQQNDQ